ncbi:VanZ family protein [Candidatus Zixiibacteriota bacterium]
MSMLQRPAPAWGGVILWASAIWIGSSLSIGSQSLLFKFGPDKVGHFVEFGILGLFTANALLTRPQLSSGGAGRKNVWRVAVIITAFWGVLDEIHQLWVPGRTSDPLDAITDILGGMVGAWLLLTWIRPEDTISTEVDMEP